MYTEFIYLEDLVKTIAFITMTKLCDILETKD